jgi:hypothetical protein
VIGNQGKDMLHTRRLGVMRILAEAGHLEAVRFVWNFATNRYPWEFTGKKRPHYAYMNDWVVGLMDRPSKDMVQFLVEKRKMHCIRHEIMGTVERTVFMRRCAQEGWEEMAGHYLELEAFGNGLPCITNDAEEKDPLMDACRNGHEGIFRLLLAYGADVSVPILEVAAVTGHIPFFQMLLGHRAEFGDPLMRAAEKGHKDVVNTLLGHGATIDLSSTGVLEQSMRQRTVSSLVSATCPIDSAGTGVCPSGISYTFHYANVGVDCV